LKGYVSASDGRDNGSSIPNSVMRDLLQYLERQLGPEPLRGILNLAGQSDYFENYPRNDMRHETAAAAYLHVIQGLQDYYDERGARAILRDLGRSTVRRAVIHSVSMAEQQGAIGGKQLLSIALDSFAKSTATRDRRHVLLQDSGDMLLVSVRQPPCWARDHGGRACEIAVGALRGALEMVTGRGLNVRPIACGRDGAHHCVFEVSRPNRWR
jgi:predicted hydrocarbon binding protein